MSGGAGTNRSSYDDNYIPIAGLIAGGKASEQVECMLGGLD